MTANMATTVTINAEGAKMMAVNMIEMVMA
jgi:hypothetical protein